MPWLATDPLAQRTQFLDAFLTDAYSVAALARQFGISRKTAYKWLARYHAAGRDGLAPRSSRPHQRPRDLTPALRGTLVALRDAHPRWGPKKLRALLADQLVTAGDPTTVPAVSTIGRLLQTTGRVAPRRRRPVLRAIPTALTTPTGPNHVWTIDFKGWFHTTDGQKCHPLTVMDSASRYLLGCIALPDIAGATVRPHLEAIFQTYGLPTILRSDNGAPFASTGLAALTSFNVWLRRLGIRLERIAPGHPEQNGRHERFHRTLESEVAVGADLVAQQRLYDAYQPIYNRDRPHEALGQRPPASVYVPSPRPYQATLPLVGWGPAVERRVVRPNGTVRFGGQEVYLTPALAGETVGLVETAPERWTVLTVGTTLGWFAADGVLRRDPTAGQPLEWL